MKTIAILTLNGYFNYGNRLQNYALQETLKEFGFDVETVINGNKPKNNSDNSFEKKIRNLKNKSPKEIYQRLIYKLWTEINKREIKQSKEIRTNIFKKFTLDYINETDYIITDDNIPDCISNKYDYFITGSDQVWNPSYIYSSPIYFLNFAEKFKRIAYAPSFGVSEITSEHKNKYKELISGIHKLSVREDDGAKIIKDLIGKDVPVLVDPTFLLTKEQWLTISKEASNKPKGKYLLTYFLGGVPENYKEQIKNITKVNNLNVIKLGYIKEKETYRTGPSEFIDYINSCSIFCTDSFHGVVFSILMEKPFIVYERMDTILSMFSRIDTLLNKFNLNSRKADNIKTNEEAFNIDYSHILPILEAERKKAFDYLKEALNVKD